MKLEDWARDLVARLPNDEEDSVEFPATSFPELPARLSCDDWVVRRGAHAYGNYRVDSLLWSGSKESFARLAFVVLGVSFQERAAVELELTSPRSEIRRFVVVRPSTFDHATGLELVPRSFRYVSSEVARHPWLHAVLDPWDLPWFELTDEGDLATTDEERAKRDWGRGCGGALGAARFARLLLDLSRPSNQRNEVDLECEVGFRGVAPGSSELRLFLPGADFWEEP